MKKNLLPALVAVSCVALSTTANAQGYDYETVDYPGSDFTNLFGVNERGDAVGNADIAPDNLPFVYGTKKGAITNVAAVAAFDDTSVLGISDSGVIVGSVYDEVSDTSSGLIIDKKGALTIFDHPDADGFTQGRGVSNSGLVAGFRSKDDPFELIVGFIFDPKSGDFTDIVPSSATIAQGINAGGDVVGSAVFLPADDPCESGAVGTVRYGWLRSSNGDVTYFRVNGQRTSARAITESGTVGGFVLDVNTGETKGFVTELDGTQCQEITIADEDLVQIPGATRTFVQGITNSGKTIVGSSDVIEIINNLPQTTSSSGFVATPK